MVGARATWMRAWAWLALLVCLGCERPATGLIVVIDAEPDVRPHNLRSIRVAVYAHPAGTLLDSDVFDAMQTPVSIAIRPTDTSRQIRIDVEGLRSPPNQTSASPDGGIDRNALIVRGRIITGFVLSTVKVVPVVLRAGCVGFRDCGTTETCDVTIPPARLGMPPSLPQPTCVSAIVAASRFDSYDAGANYFRMCDPNQFREGYVCRYGAEGGMAGPPDTGVPPDGGPLPSDGGAPPPQDNGLITLPDSALDTGLFTDASAD